MKIIPELLSEGKKRAFIKDQHEKDTRKGRKSLYTCKITSSGEDEGKEAEFLIPSFISKNTLFFKLIESVLGNAEIGDEVDTRKLIGICCIAHIKNVKKGGHTYSNIVAIGPIEGE